MKLFLTMIATLLFSSATVAAEINVPISGKQGGSSYTRSVTLAEFLEDQGYTVNLIKTFNGKKALNWFEQSDQPTALAILDSVYAVATNEAVKPDQVGVIEFESYLYLCGDVSNLDSINFSWRSDYPDGFEEFLEQFYNKPVTSIPYDSSSAEREAVAAGDVDLVLFNVKNAERMIEQGIPCNYYTGAEIDTKRNSTPLRTKSDDKMSTLAFTYFVMMKNIPDATTFRT